MIRPESLFAPRSAVATLDAPLDHLMACHRRIEERLDLLERAAAHLDVSRDEALEAFQAAFRFLDSNGVQHTADEEESLFPRLLPLLEQGERAYLAGLEHDHAEAHQLYTELKLSLAGAIEPARVQALTARLTGLYRRHIASEDETLQSLSRERLNAPLLEEIAREMKRRRGLAEDTGSADPRP